MMIINAGSLATAKSNARKTASPQPTSNRILRPRSSEDRKSTRLNSSHDQISYAVFCLKKKKKSATPHDLRFRSAADLDLVRSTARGLDGGFAELGRRYLRPIPDQGDRIDDHYDRDQE